MNIFKILKSKKSEPVQVHNDLSGRARKEYIEEIHNEFNSEVDKILREAGIMLSPPSESNEVIKGRMLDQLGFNNTEGARSFREYQKCISDTRKINRDKDIVCKAAKYFSDKYPMYKFITAEAIDRICNNYGLAWGFVNNYIGDVPYENLVALKNFKIDPEDCVIEGCSLKLTDGVNRALIRSLYRGNELEFELSKYKENPFIIVAPKKDFMTSENVRWGGNRLEIDDPIVLKQVAFEYNEKHYTKIFYLIATAWGEEASDKDVINHNHQ